MRGRFIRKARRTWQSFERRVEPRWNAMRHPPGTPPPADRAALLARLRNVPPSDGPRLACVVISYRDQPGVVRAVSSLVAQDPPAEVVVVNSGGGDPARRLAAQGLDVPVVNRAERLYAGGARNAGIAATRAPFVAFLAADCVARPGWVRGRLRAHEAGALAVSSAVTNPTPANPYACVAHLLLYNQRLPATPPDEAIHYGVSYARTVLTHFGGFREDLRASEDTAFNERLRGIVPFTWAADVQADHRHPTTLGRMLGDEWARGRRAARMMAKLTGLPHGRLMAGYALTRLPRAWRRTWRVVSPAQRRRMLRALPLLPLTALAFAGGAVRAAGWRKHPRVLALLQCRNEMRYLPGYLENVPAHVDGIVALDDGSTDGSADLLAAHPAVVRLLRNPPREPHTWDEPENRRRLVDAAREAGAAWLLAVDADERLERRFRRRMRKAIDRAARHGHRAVQVRLRELWDDPLTYRVDGIWGDKTRARLFALRDDHAHDERALHGQWAPINGHAVAPPRADAAIYHLRMLHPADRAARRARYEALDPQNRWQAVGYAYLTDDTGLELERIPRGRRYGPLTQTPPGGPSAP